MTKKQDIFTAIELVLLYIFIYLFLYSVKYDVNMLLISFVLLVLVYVACNLDPYMRETHAWKKLFSRERE
ncbi:hypothetical protein ACFLYU_02520 [Candidatus Dependentiae bacterium]